MSTERRIDIGGDHILVLVTPDGADEPTGVEVEHLTPAGKPCVGWINFAVARNHHLPDAPVPDAAVHSQRADARRPAAGRRVAAVGKILTPSPAA